MSDDVQRRARRAARIATYQDSETRHRAAVAVPPGDIPTLEQLVSGAQPVDGDPAADARVWARELYATRAGDRLVPPVRDALRRLHEDPTAETAEAVEAAALAAIAGFEADITIEDLLGEIADRACLYGALMGSSTAAGRAVAIVHDALHSYLHLAGGDPVPLRELAVTFIQFAGLCRRDLPATSGYSLMAPSWPVMRGSARTLLRTLAGVADAPAEILTDEDAPRPSSAWRVAEQPDVAELAEALAPGIVVLPADLESKKPSGPAKALVGKRLPLHPMPDLAALGERLVARRPWLVPEISRVLGTLAGRETVSLPNFLFVGQPGTGKTELARELAEGLGTPFMVYGCAGISDSSIAGTSKQWSTARYSVFTQLLVDNQSGDGILILDELDKSGATGGHNGSLREAIVAVGEQAARRRFFDLGIDGVVDISGVSLIATANDVSSLRGPLLDRFTVIKIPPPRRQDLPVVARGILETLRADLVDGRWLADLDEAELGSLASWRGGSIRPLRRAIERLVALRADRRFAH